MRIVYPSNPPYLDIGVGVPALKQLNQFKMSKLKLVSDVKRTASAVKISTKYPKIAIVTFNDGDALTSVEKHYDAEGNALFLNDNNELLPGWTQNGDWLVAPGAGGGISLANAK